MSTSCCESRALFSLADRGGLPRTRRRSDSLPGCVVLSGAQETGCGAQAGRHQMGTALRCQRLHHDVYAISLQTARLPRGRWEGRSKTARDPGSTSSGLRVAVEDVTIRSSRAEGLSPSASPFSVPAMADAHSAARRRRGRSRCESPLLSDLFEQPGGGGISSAPDPIYWHSPVTWHMRCCPVYNGT